MWERPTSFECVIEVSFAITESQPVTLVVRDERGGVDEATVDIRLCPGVL